MPVSQDTGTGSSQMVKSSERETKAVKWDCGPTWDEKLAARTAWHRWFAWHPVRVGSHDCRWLEYVERSGEPSYPDGWDWEYRPAQSEE